MANEIQIIMVTLAIGIVSYCCYLYLEDSFATGKQPDIKYWATYDTLKLGQYDDVHTPYSVRTYCLSAMVYAEVYGKLARYPEDWYEFFTQWRKDYCHDELGYVQRGIDKAVMEFDKELESAREEDRDPSFKVGVDFDLDCIPESSLNNYYYNLNTLADLLKKGYSDGSLVMV